MAGSLRFTAYAAAVALLAGGCGASDPEPPAPNPSASSTPSGSSTGSGSPGATPSSPGTPQPTEPGLDLLDWQPVAADADALVTESGPWRLVVSADGSRATLDGAAARTVGAGPGRRISDALLEGQHALIVAQDVREEEPAVATVVDLETGEARLLVDGRSEVPTTTGGTWALGADQAYYASAGARGYCLAAVDLETGAGRVTWCAPERHGFSNARVGADGTLSVLAFDDSRPSCRTLVTVGADEVTPYPGVEECAGWEGVSLAGARVWTAIPDERRIEQAHVYAAAPDGAFDLGDATSGSLLACGGAAYFTRDAGGGRPAQVLRWSAETGFDVVYRAPAAREGFIVSPLRCGGDHLTLTSLTPAGDEQVTARVGR